MQSEVMELVEGSCHNVTPEFGVLDVQRVQEAVERIEPFLKGQGYLPIGGNLRVLNATAEEAYLVLDLIFRLASQQQLDDRSREQLRDQADKDRVALAHAQKRNETLDESNRKLVAQVKELESKLLAAKHKAEEQERELKQKLQSTTVRLNGYLYGGRDAGKRTIAGTGCGGGANTSAAAAGPRRVAPAYDRFRDDPTEAAAAAKILEAELSQLRQQNARLKKQLAAARDQLGGSPRSLMSVDSPVRDGQRGDQLATVTESSAIGDKDGLGGDRRRIFDMQAMRRSLDVTGGLSSSTSEIGRLQRLVRDLQLTLDQQQRQLDKAAGDRSELHKTLSSLRSKCASLEVERKNAEDRFLRAQRATAALLEPAASEPKFVELQVKLAGTERDLCDANIRADGLQQRLLAAEVELESSQRHVGVLKRAIRALPKGQEALEQLGRLVAEEIKPLCDQLRDVKAELEAAKAAQSALADAQNEEFSSTSGTSGHDLPTTSTQSAQSVRSASYGLALSPTMPLPSSPVARFEGFGTRPGAAVDSPPLLMQPPPVHAYYNRAFSSTMPSERLMASISSLEGLHDTQHPRMEMPSSGATANPKLTQPTSDGGGGGVCGAVMRRSLSAGVTHRVGEAYTSADRQRARWQVHNLQVRQRFPSPIDIIMEQARNPTTEDATISIMASPVREANAEPSSRGSSPR
ncbi:hypothetical protein VaNZ11_013193 [Volvox africanus]|uniref:Centrosomal protein of 70 kDa n=1 Tax=Volvox africanus TaxID=51714 RepID=A0ABQ5SFS2_9CHLO|nr:hypothetical protein VaNZ11_013193 [Volvox africanus]